MRRLGTVETLVRNLRGCARAKARAWAFAAAAWLAVTSTLGAQERRKIVAEWWEAAYLQGARSGHVHTIVEEIDQDGLKTYRSAIELRLNVKRFKDVIQLAMDNGTHELPEGTVFGTFMKQMVGKNKALEIIGTVDGKRLTLTRDKSTVLNPTPWDPEVLSVYKQKTVFRDRKVKPGDSFSYKSFEPTINVVVVTSVEVKDEEEVELFGGKHKRRLLRVDAKAQKVGNFQLPPFSAWLDENLMPVRSQTDIPGLGTVTMYQATRSFALAPAGTAPALDVGVSHYVRLKQRIVRPHDTAAAVYRISVKGEEDVASTFARDGRQDVKNVKGSTLELHVRHDAGTDKGDEPAAEFTQSSYFITSADAKVREFAKQAAGDATQPWQKARKIEKWVHDRMRIGNHEGLAPADHVARTLVGDCTEFAMLTAAMCRAEGIPAKTAMGLIYADVSSGPVFAFHMWTEVWIDGRWRSLDATLGLGRVGAAHLKISDQSWHDERSLTPLLPVVRVLGKLNIEVVRVEGK
ncbi:MAG: transglutaminase family protein [Gemmataceae bacterium]|nr:transglutaminase family protein [Gemmataceae bacterium]